MNVSGGSKTAQYYISGTYNVDQRYAENYSRQYASTAILN